MTRDSQTTDSGVGLHYVDLADAALNSGDALQFTFYWLESDRWEGKNFQVDVQGAAAHRASPSSTVAKKPLAVAVTA
jgi:hypothetical protein